MRKESARNLIIGVAVAVLLIFSASSLNLLSIFGGGVTVLSLSQPTFSSNDPTIGGKAYLATAVANGAGQYLEGSIVSGTTTPTGEKTRYPFTIKVNSVSEQCVYPFINQNAPIYKYQFALFDDALAVGWDSNAYCKSKGYEFGGKKSGSFIFVCARKVSVATYGTLGTPALNFETSVTVSNGSKTDTAIINNKGSTSAWIGSNVYASWVGSLVSGEQCPISSDSKVSAIYLNSWKTIDDNTYQAYKGAIPDAVSGDQKARDCIQTYWDDVYCANLFNNYVNPVLTSSKNIQRTDITNTAIWGAEYWAYLDKLVQYPQLTFRIKADFLGIAIPVGKPQIVSVSSSKFQTGQSGYITATVSNIGDGTGSFDVSASCNSPFTYSAVPPRMTLQPNTQSTVYLPITGTASGTNDILGSCTVTAKDVNQPLNLDTRTVSVTVSPILVCPNIGEKRCDGNTLTQCVGSGWANIYYCPTGCDSTTQACRPGTGTNGTNPVPIPPTPDPVVTPPEPAVTEEETNAVLIGLAVGLLAFGGAIFLARRRR